MVYTNKIHLKVKRDLNWWFYFWKWRYRLQLCWHSGKWGFFLKQYADKLWKREFMKDFTEILEAMEKDNNQSIFSLYELPVVINWVVEE